MVDIICMNLRELQGEKKTSEKYKMKFSCQQWDSNPVLSTYKADALPIAPRDMLSTLG